MSNLQPANKAPLGPPQRSGHETDPSDRRADGDAAPAAGFDRNQPRRSERDRFAPLPIIPF